MPRWCHSLVLIPVCERRPLRLSLVLLRCIPEAIRTVSLMDQVLGLLGASLFCSSSVGQGSGAAGRCLKVAVVLVGKGLLVVGRPALGFCCFSYQGILSEGQIRCDHRMTLESGGFFSFTSITAS